MLEAENISVGYWGKVILNDISFRLPEGRIIALLGANGAGKTTLLRALNGTLLLNKGALRLGKRELKDMRRREIARRIAVVAQENETRFPVTVLEFVLSGRFAHGSVFGWETEEDIHAAERALGVCELEGMKGNLMNELSGGERQRVLLARALATEAKILLLDEPTANLDLSHQAMMFRLVKERCAGAGSSAVIITHDLNLASEFAHEVLLLNGGRISAHGPPAEVLTERNLEAAYGVKVLLDLNPRTGNVRVTTLF